MYKKKIITGTGLASGFLLFIGFLSGCSYTRVWEGTVQPDHIHVSFKDMNGRQKLEMKNLKNGSYLKYEANISEGKLNLQVRSATSTLVSKQINSKEKDSVFIGGIGKDNYVIVLNGKKASGTVDIVLY